MPHAHIRLFACMILACRMLTYASLRAGSLHAACSHTPLCVQDPAFIRHQIPFVAEARSPLTYLGTRWELESEILRIRVYDWDAFTADDLIGSADVPLAGILDYGRLQVGREVGGLFGVGWWGGWEVSWGLG